MSHAEPATSPPSRRARILRLVRITVSVLAFVWLAYSVDLRAVIRTVGRMPLSHALVAEATVVLSMAIGAARHRALLAAFGATERPSFLACFRLFFVGFFYNTFLPGSVAGDAVRAVSARESFGEQGTTASFAVVLVERILGLFALVVVAGVAFAVRPLVGVGGLHLFAVVGVVAAIAGVVCVPLARRLGSVLPGALGAIFARLPELRSVPDFAASVALSFASQLTVAATGHALVTGLADGISPLVSAVVVPVGAASAYVPITVSGLGVREAAFARLYQLADVPADAAAAFALAFLGVQLVAAGVGGLLTLVDPRHS